jgi:hypothetical protein
MGCLLVLCGTLVGLAISRLGPNRLSLVLVLPGSLATWVGIVMLAMAVRRRPNRRQSGETTSG